MASRWKHINNSEAPTHPPTPRKYTPAFQVKWHVCISSVGINPIQRLDYQYALSGIENYRPVQPRNGRVPVSYTNA